MASSPEFISYLCEKLSPCGDLLAKKMFGEWLIYIEGKPVVLVCDGTAYLKMLPALSDFLHNGTAVPYPGAKEHYILDPDDENLLKIVALALAMTPLPKPRKKKQST